MSADILDGYTEDELNAILESDDPDKIEALLNGEKQKAPAADESAADEGDELEAESDKSEAEKNQGDKSATPGAEGTETPTEEPYIESKSGGNKIPYGVLDATRKERNELRKQLDEANQQLSQFKNSHTKMASALEQQGIDLAALERGETLDAEQLAELERLDPTVAKLARFSMANFERMTQLSQQLEELKSAPVITPEALAFRSNTDLVTWKQSDPERWEMALQYDDLVKQDPAFKNATPEKRFAEVVARTKQLFGDSAKPAIDPTPKPQRESAEEIAAKKIAAASKSVPRSLTDLGVTPTAERSQLEVIGDLDGDALIDRIAALSPDMVDKLLAEGYSE